MSKEAAVIILDVGRTMSADRTSFDGAVTATRMLVQDKIQQGHKQDLLSIVLFGARETKNTLYDREREVAGTTGGRLGYEHVYVLADPAMADLNMLRAVDQIVPGGRTANFVDALIVAMDLLHGRTAGKKYERRIYLITDAGCKLGQQDAQVMEMLRKRMCDPEMSTRLNVIRHSGVGFEINDEGVVAPPDPARGRTAEKAHNERELAAFAAAVDGRVLPVAEAIEVLAVMKARSVLQRTLLKTQLCIGDAHIPVSLFTKTAEAKFPSLKPVNQGGGEVQLQRSYRPADKPDDLDIPSDELVRAYRYGRDLVPFSAEDEEAMKMHTEKGLKVLGFAPRGAVPRHHFMAGCAVVVGDPGIPEAPGALAALSRALREQDCVAIARYVYRDGLAPKICCLLPASGPQWEGLLYQQLPFADDVRSYLFAKLPQLGGAADGRTPQLTMEMLEAADGLITALDLSAVRLPSGETAEVLRPKETFNPVLQHFRQCVHARALQPNAPLPQLDPLIEAHLQPPPSLVEHAKPAFERFRASVPLERVVKETPQRRIWADSMAAAAAESSSDVLASYSLAKKPRHEPARGAASSGGGAPFGRTVDHIGTLNPVQDFQDMLGRHDVDLVSTAVREMGDVILTLVRESTRDALYDKALDCLRTLRTGCIIECEPAAFNSALRRIRAEFEHGPRSDFWARITAAGITLLSADDFGGDDTVAGVASTEEAQTFLTASTVSVSEAAAAAPAPASAEVDLFDMAD